MRKIISICLIVMVSPSIGSAQLNLNNRLMDIMQSQNNENRRKRYPVDLYQISNPFVYEAVLSTAAMIPRDRLIMVDGGGMIEQNPTQRTKSCRMSIYQKKFGQGSSANCAGFLVGGDLIATAGHCLLNRDLREACANDAWVFGYAVTHIEDDPYLVDANDVYYCREVIHAVNDPYGRDFALIRLDRPVEGRSPLRIRRNGEVPSRAQLVAIGFPDGLPAKITPAGGVHTNISSSEFMFSADLEIFKGNSGGPVIDIDTGLVEGITSSIGVGDLNATSFNSKRHCLEISTTERTTEVNRAVNLWSILDIENF